MLAKCANPICGAPFLYLNQGRIFNVPAYGPGTQSCAWPQRMEHFWLCSSCLLTLTLALQNGKVEVRARYPQLTDGSAPKAPKPVLSPQSKSAAA